MDKELYATGRHIHNELLRRATNSVSLVPELWKRDHCIHASLLLWPSDEVLTTKGEPFSGVVFSEVPAFDNASTRLHFLTRATAQVDAYALLLIEELDDCVRCIFESQHGTESWRLPIKDHGGMRVLGVAAKRTNAESIGILWKAN